MKKIIVIAIASLTLLASCHNLYTKLVPKEGNAIVSFSFDGGIQEGSSSIGANRVSVTVKSGSDVTSLVPRIQASEKATVLPVTYEYIKAAFPSTSPEKLVKDWVESADKASWALRVINENKNFSVPALNLPVNFSMPVMLAVISAQGTTRLYTVNVSGGKDGSFEPTADNKLLTFSVDGQKGESIISHDPPASVSFKIGQTADIRGLYPSISVSENAHPLPLTAAYLTRAFPKADIYDVIFGYYLASNKATYLRDFIKNADYRPVTNLDLPIDFTDSGKNPVPIAVISWDYQVSLYEARAQVVDTAAQIKEFGFSKSIEQNAALMKDCRALINEGTKTITVQAVYPYEHLASGGSYELVPSFTLAGQNDSGENAELYLVSAGTESKLEAGITAVNCASEVTLRAKRKDNPPVDYKLIATKTEDPDTIRSITDLRFTRTHNPSLVANAVAVIQDDKGSGSGTITVSVPYTGIKPAKLRLSFISPGTVSDTSGKTLISGTAELATSETPDLICTSKDGSFKRRYALSIQYTEILPTVLPVLYSFGFSAAANGTLTADASGRVDNASKAVAVEVKYAGGKPASLIPVFSASGPVTVSGVPQLSGISGQNFAYTLTYSVHDTLNPAITSDYRVQVIFTADNESACAINSIVFTAAKNPLILASDVKADIQNTRSYVQFPFGTKSESRNLTVTINVSGILSMAGTSYPSGEITGRFSGDIPLTVTSKNGRERKTYILSVRETGNVIYVKNDAWFGEANGSSWQNAFTSLEAALAYARTLPENQSLDFYIASTAIEYSPPSGNAFVLRANSRYYGGFTENEANPAERKRSPSGDLLYRTILSGNGQRVLTAIAMQADLTIDGFEIKNGKAPAADQYGGGFYQTLKAGVSAKTTITNCKFSNNIAIYADPYGYNSGSGGGAYVSNAIIENCIFENNKCGVPVKDVKGIYYDMGGGGGLHAKNSIITSCTFTGNEAHNRQHSNNSSTPSIGGGGALMVFASSVTSCDFTDNKATSGGAISAAENSKITLCTFIGNTYVPLITSPYREGTGGGAIALLHGKIEKCTFENNSAINGGAIFMRSNKPAGVTEESLVTDCTFTRNSSLDTAGAIWAFQGAVTDSKFYYNTAAKSGGAVYTGRYTNCIFTGNEAEVGGGVYGGAYTNCIFTGNKAQKGGGGAYASAYTDCTFTDNEAQRDGGGAYGGAYDGAYTDCTFTDNKAQRGGAVAMLNKASLTGNTFNRNTASVTGGAVYYNLFSGESVNTVTIQGSQFTENTAPAGSAISVEFNQEGISKPGLMVKAIITGNTFTANTGTSPAGKIISAFIVGTSVIYPKSIEGLVANPNTNKGLTIPIIPEEVYIQTGITKE